MPDYRRVGNGHSSLPDGPRASPWSATNLQSFLSAQIQQGLGGPAFSEGGNYRGFEHVRCGGTSQPRTRSGCHWIGGRRHPVWLESMGDGAGADKEYHPIHHFRKAPSRTDGRASNSHRLWIGTQTGYVGKDFERI